MKDAVLIELAKRWERLGKEPEVRNGSPDAAIGNAVEDGVRAGVRTCVRELRELVKLLGETDS